jgi:hypothetical protein
MEIIIASLSSVVIMVTVEVMLKCNIGNRSKDNKNSDTNKNNQVRAFQALTNVHREDCEFKFQHLKAICRRCGHSLHCSSIV